MVEKAPTPVKYQRVADYQPKRYDCDKTVKTAEVLDKDILILEVQELQGEKNPYLSMLISDADGKNKAVLNCGGVVVVRKIKEAMARTQLPLLICIFKVKNYLDIK